MALSFNGTHKEPGRPVTTDIFQSKLSAIGRFFCRQDTLDVVLQRVNFQVQPSYMS